MIKDAERVGGWVGGRGDYAQADFIIEGKTGFD